jgi:ABC-type polysaccharide/polyol phosphate transport system ATPase subunit
MSETVLRVENVAKKFCRSLKRSLWYGVQDLANMTRLSRNGRTELRQDEFWALKGVSFELCEGETLGLIGHNGAGKSTLLKLINNLIKPDAGSIGVRGHVGALIELGSGFNPILTGRENIYVNAAILGLRRKEVDRRLDTIIDFAELGDFIDTPVQSYSSGMKARLGFAIAAHLAPDLLLIDEVLSVGDSSFRQRCIARLADYKSQGGTIIFVSHHSTVVERVCDRVMWLDHGRIVTIGEPAEVIQMYEARALELSRQADSRISRVPEQQGTYYGRLSSVECYDLSGRSKPEFEFGESFEIRMDYKISDEVCLPYFVLGLKKGERLNPAVSTIDMMWDGIRLDSIPRQGQVGCIIRKPPLSPGMYHIYAGIVSKISSQFGEKWYIPLTELGSVTITPGSLRQNLPGVPAGQLIWELPPMILEHTWRVNGNQKSL